MITLEYKYIYHITELKKRGSFIYRLRLYYKTKIRIRLYRLRQQFKKGLIEKDAFNIWEKLLIKNI